MKVYRSVLQILRELPDDLKPRAGDVDWDKYSATKVTDWFKTHYTDARFEATLTVWKVTVNRNYAARDDPSQPQWKIDFMFSTISSSYMGHTYRQILRPGGGGSALTLYGDEAFAKRAERIRQGMRVRMIGTIKSVTPGSYYHNKSRDMNIELKDCVISSPLLKP